MNVRSVRLKLVRIFAVAIVLGLVIQISLFMRSPIPTEFKDPENTASTLLLDGKKFDELGTKLAVKPITGTDGIPVFSSVAVAELGESGLKTKNYQSSGVASDTLFSADSMTKMVTAAAILRMTEEEKYQQFLPKGIDTELSVLLPLLKKHYSDSTYIQTELELQPDFESITLKHLAQHTSGLAPVKSDAFRDVNQKLTPDEMIDAAKKPKTGEFGERIGEYCYSNLGYELLGRVIVAIDSEQKGHTSKFGDVVDEFVMSRVREKVGEEEKKEQSAESLRFFTSDQMEIVDGRTAVAAHPELSVKFGKDYHSGKFKETPSHFYDMASGGSYTNPESMSKIAFHVLHSEPEFSVFKKPETLAVFNSGQVEIPKLTADGKYKAPSGKTYGFGYESYSDPTYRQYRTHGGLGYGSNSNVFVDTKGNKVAVAFVGFENLTLPLAYALINKEKPEPNKIRLTPELYEKTLQLKESYSERELLEMRKELDFSNKRATDALDLATPKKPSPSPEKSDAEKMAGKSKNGANEI